MRFLKKLKYKIMIWFSSLRKTSEREPWIYEKEKDKNE